MTIYSDAESGNDSSTRYLAIINVSAAYNRAISITSMVFGEVRKVEEIFEPLYSNPVHLLCVLCHDSSIDGQQGESNQFFPQMLYAMSFLNETSKTITGAIGNA